MERVIFHCDLNSFYASVELLDHPELRHLPVAVCGDPESRHGIILAKNEPKPNGSRSRRRRPSGRPNGSAPTWCSFRPTTGCIGSFPDGSTGCIRTTPIWWSPSASMRAGWMCPAPSTCSGRPRSPGG